MDIITDIPELKNRLAQTGRIVFVPTMGNLHAGHVALVKKARVRGDCVVTSIFVNPLQFGVNEDFSSYPRSLREDCEKLAAAQCDVVFAPSETTFYPQTQDVFVEPPPMAAELCGASRPGHFRGVATVVLKLFNLVQPQIAVFGKKDFQQLLIVRHMVAQLAIPVEIAAHDTVREADGLAMSSRNAYLTPAQREEAPRLFKALQQAVLCAQAGTGGLPAIESQTTHYLNQSGWDVDYIAIRSAATLAAPQPGETQLVALGAAKLGKTRLIDNIEFTL